MAGLRNSGIDSSDWYLPGHAGTELLIGGGGQRYNPDALFGGNLGTGPAPLYSPLLTANFLAPEAGNVGLDSTTWVEQSSSPPTQYVFGWRGGLQDISGLSETTPTPRDFLSYDEATGALRGYLVFPGARSDGNYRPNLGDSTNWLGSGAVLTGNSFSPTPGDGTAFSTITADGTTGVHRAQSTVDINQFGATNHTGAYLKPGNAATTHAYLEIFDRSTPANFSRVTLEFATGTLTSTLGGTGTLFDSLVRQGADGWWFVEFMGHPGGTGTDGVIAVGIANADGPSFAGGGQILQVDWMRFTRANSGTLGGTFTVATFGGGGLTPSQSLGYTFPPLANPATGWTLLVDFTVDHFANSTDALVRRTPMRFIGTAGTIAISHQASTGTHYAVYANAAGTTLAQIAWVPAKGVRQTAVFRATTNDFSLHVNGVLIGTDTVGTITTTGVITEGGDGLGSAAASVTPCWVLRKVILANLVSAADALTISSNPL